MPLSVVKLQKRQKTDTHADIAEHEQEHSGTLFNSVIGDTKNDDKFHQDGNGG